MTRPRLVTGARLRYDEVREEHVLLLVALLVGDLSALVGGVEVVDLGADDRRVVHLVVDLVLDLLGHPHHAPHRSEREQQELGEEAHL